MQALRPIAQQKGNYWMNIDQAFPSKYLKAADLNNRTSRLVIASIQIEEVGTADKPEKKPVVYLVGAQKGLVLGRFKAEAIAIVHGRETDAWIGKTIELYPATAAYKGKPVPAIGVRGILAGPVQNMPLGGYQAPFAPAQVGAALRGPLPDVPPAMPGDFDHSVEPDDSIPF